MLWAIHNCFVPGIARVDKDRNVARYHFALLGTAFLLSIPINMELPGQLI